MKGYLASLVATGIAFVVAAKVVPGISFPATDMKDPGKDIVVIAAVAIVFGIANGLVKPVLTILTFPISLMTMGLVGIVINAGLLVGVAWIAEKLDIVLKIGNFPPHLLTSDTIVAAVIGSIVIGLVGAVARMAVRG